MPHVRDDGLDQGGVAVGGVGRTGQILDII